MPCWRPTDVRLANSAKCHPERAPTERKRRESKDLAFPHLLHCLRTPPRGLLATLLLLSLPALASDVRISVFSLFHPTVLTVQPNPGTVLSLTAGSRTLLLDDSHSARVRLASNSIQCTVASGTFAATSIRVASRNSEPADFLLTVPGKLQRHFHGVLDIRPDGRALLAVVTMDLEVAVASAVAAESLPGASLEALKAQAVVTRTYYAAGSRHHDFDFCDTTHCQFLRQPPSPGAPASLAAKATSGLVLAYRGAIFPAMYSARCGGHTRTPADIGLRPGPYPYYSVTCEYCLRHPGPGPALAYGPGHGVGLCQRGAAGMAASGSTFQEILGHYYPNTALSPLPPR